eukprot:TRINITY_DN10228_c1_g1_i1.p2 TRINITY_DN10228_c1_g1~~TRINITY_DN10228_c1_g1_i1.p2  ORF type:complete len:101 (+),score=0.65 TRINITY_DN10228_c1_g1_i1:2087-2389(+)
MTPHLLYGKETLLTSVYVWQFIQTMSLKITGLYVESLMSSSSNLFLAYKKEITLIISVLLVSVLVLERLMKHCKKSKWFVNEIEFDTRASAPDLNVFKNV